jgi:two-component system, NtrC family, nitrogen regulation sensor histidine kinase NtrY
VSRRRLPFQNRLLLGALLCAAPAWVTASIALYFWSAAEPLRWTLFVGITLAMLAGALLVRGRVVRPLQALANMLEALREGDYSLRGRHADARDALGEVMIEVNALSQMLHDERLETLEAGALLNKIGAEVDIAVFAFDAGLRLRLANRAAASLLAAPAEQLEGQTARDLGLESLLSQPSGRIAAHTFPGRSGRWEIRRRSFRDRGRPHELLVISDLSRALREEERQTWQRLVRVIGHEINGSLAPIQSMAGTLNKLIGREPLPGDWRDDTHAGLTIIHDRAEALGRFMNAYARLARLPPPTRRPTDLTALVRRTASLHRGRVTVFEGPAVVVDADADQLEQVLINLIKNGVEAAAERGGVRIRWRTAEALLVIEIDDDGPGLARTDNLWVPFYTTKPGGTGIGLVLSREIVENHGGSLALENRAAAQGCIARVMLPLGRAAAAGEPART